MKALLIGGAGQISSAVTGKLLKTLGGMAAEPGKQICRS